MGLRRRLLAVVGVGIAAIGAAGWWASGLLFISARHRDIPEPPAERGFVEVQVTSSNGRLGAWLAGTPADHGCALLVHGMGGDRRGLSGRVPFFEERGLAVLLIDLQAHGESEGTTLTFGHLEQHDVTASVAWLRDAGCTMVIVNAFSMGAAATLLSAPVHRADALIVEASFATLHDAAFRRMETLVGPLAPLATPLVTVQLRPRLGFGIDEVRPVDAAAQIRTPTLVIGGEHDPRAPVTETRAIADALAGPSQLWIVPGASHHNFQRFDPDGWEQHVGHFLDALPAGSR